MEMLIFAQNFEGRGRSLPFLIKIGSEIANRSQPAQGRDFKNQLKLKR